MRKEVDIFDAIPALNSDVHHKDVSLVCPDIQNSLKTGGDEQLQSRRESDSEERKAIVETKAEIEDQVQRFQEEKMERAAVATAFSSALLAAVRR